jgi:hypothetical protein
METPSAHAKSTHESIDVSTVHKEVIDESSVALDLTQIDPINLDNYHGLHAKTIIVYVSLLLIAFVQIFNLVGAGAVSPEFMHTLY